MYFRKGPLVEIEPEDFSEVESYIHVRETLRGTKLEGAFRKVKSKVIGQYNHHSPRNRKEGDVIKMRRCLGQKRIAKGR